MNSRLSMFSAVLRKDVAMLWPLAVAAFVLIAWNTALGPAPSAFFGDLRIGFRFAAYAAGVLLIAAVIQADAPSSARHDWLTRPIPGSVLLAAKAVFIVAALAIPTMLGEVIAGVRADFPPGEIALRATRLQLWPFVAMLCLIAVLTASIVESGIVLAATFAVVALLVHLVEWLLDASLVGSGFAWVPNSARLAIILAMFCVAMWMVYCRRAIRRARILCVTITLLLVLLPALIPNRAYFAVQKSLSSDPTASAAVSVVPLDGCLPAIRVNPPLDGQVEPRSYGGEEPLQPYTLSLSDFRGQEAGPNAIGFETRIAMTGVPDGWRARVNRVDGAYVSAAGHVEQEPQLATPWAALSRRDSNGVVRSHFWLLSRADYERMAAVGVRLHLDYSLTLLRPSHTAELAIDGKRRRIDGFGYCSAVFDQAKEAVEADCVKGGSQPAQIIATMKVGDATVEAFNGPADYAPAILEGFGRRYVMAVRAANERADHVVLTSYEGVAHFSREVVVPGILGGSSAECPAP